MKKVKVIWTDESLGDLEAIYEFVAIKSPRSAEKSVQGILKRTGQLETFPHAGSPHEAKIATGREYRYLVEGHYKIIYSLIDAVLYIEAVIDTRRNPDTGKI